MKQMKCILQICSQYNITKYDIANYLDVGISVIELWIKKGLSEKDEYFNILKEKFPDIKADPNTKPIKHFKKHNLDLNKLPDINYKYKEKERPSEFPKLIKKTE